MARIFFLSVHGTLLVRGDRPGTIAHRALRDVPDMGALLAVEADDAALRPGFAQFVENAAPPAVPVEGDPLGPVRLHVDAGSGLVSIGRDGGWLSALPGHEAGWVETEAREWESFLPISQATLGQVVALCSNDWIVRSSRSVVHSWQVDFAPGHLLKLADVAVPLARNLPLLAPDFPFRFHVLLEGWRLEEILLFKPLVATAAFNSPEVHAQLFLSLGSLLEFGRFTGQVHVLTDLDPERIHAAVPALSPDRLSVQNLAPTDFVGYVAAKYALLEHQPAWNFQPVCFLDPDTVINAPLRPMLIETALADSLTAPVEDVGPLRSWPPVGGTLLQRDGREARFARGFNAGTLGIPNLRLHEHTLRLIRRIMENLHRQEGRGALEWVDQEVANYVSFVHAHVETAAISRHIRHGAPHDSETPGPRTGLVHFWATGKAGRSEIMRNYIDVLREHDRIAHKLAN